MLNKDIYILGVGRNTEVYIDLVEACGYNPIGLYHYDDTRTGEKIHNIPILNSNTNLFSNNSLKGKLFAISVGDNRIRANLSKEINVKGGITPTLIHPNAVVSKYATIGEGVVIHPNAIIQAGACIGNDTVISFCASVTHTSVVGKACYLAALAHIGAYVKVNDFVLVGQGAIIVSSKVSYIGANSIIGAGAVVINNIEPDSVVAGNPAKTIRKL